jgi:Tfp pilus assembly protein PilF
MLTARTRGLILGALTADLAVLVYLNALSNPFVHDDLVGVVGNPALAAGAGLLALVRQNVFRPMVNLSFAVDHALWGEASRGYHLTSVLLHALNTALLFALGRRAAADWRARAGGSTPDADVVGLVAAGLFAVHPLMSEAVGYVSARGDVLAATFVLGALLALRAGVARTAWRPLGVALTLAAVATKETALVLPIVALAADRLLLDGDTGARRRRLLAWHVPLIALAAALALARVAGFLWIERTSVPVAAWSHLQAQPGVVWRYLALLAMPLRQSIVHGVSPATSSLDPRAPAAALALLAVGWLAWRGRRRAPLVVFGITWFLLFLAPAMAVALYEPMAERRVYLAGAGVFLAVAAATAGVWAGASRATRQAGAVAFAVVLVALGVLTVSRNLVWRDAVTLWRDATLKAPAEWRAHAGLANALGEQGRCDQALPEYETALRLSPQPEVYTNYGVCLAAEHRVGEATRAFDRALALDPRYPLAHHNLGLLALHAGDFEGAHAHFLSAVSMYPRDAWWRQTLMRIYELEIRDPAKTLELCRAIVRVAGRETPGALDCLERYERRATATP